MTVKNWPPLIVSSRKPTWVVWRDVLLTAAMWIVFAIMLETEFELFFGRYLERWGLGDFGTEANWDVFFQRLSPFIVLALLLIGALTLSAVFTHRRRRRGLTMPQPAPLGIADEARRVGMDEADLAAARKMVNVVVSIDETGRHYVKPR